MNEENKNNEEVSESVDTPAEEITEAAEETAVEEAVVEAAEDAEEIAAETADEQAAEGEIIEGTDELDKADEPKKGLSNGAIAGIAAGAVVVIAAVVIFLVVNKFIGGSNSYNDQYIDIDGTTAADMANNQCMEYDEYLEYLHLPADLPEDTNSNAAQNLIPIGRWAELQGGTFEQFKEMCSWDDSITETTPYGEAIDKTALKYVIGEEQLDYFKQIYGLDDKVNADTKFGEIRNTVDEFSRKQYEDQRKQEEEVQEAADQADETAEDEAAEDADSAENAESSDNADAGAEEAADNAEEKAE